MLQRLALVCRASREGAVQRRAVRLAGGRTAPLRRPDPRLARRAVGGGAAAALLLGGGWCATAGGGAACAADRNGDPPDAGLGAAGVELHGVEFRRCGQAPPMRMNA